VLESVLGESFIQMSIEIEREWLALTVRDTKVARPGLIVDLVSEDAKYSITILK